MSGSSQTRWIVFVLILSGCAQEPERAQHTVEGYRSDSQLRLTQLARCQNDPGTLAETPDCINAERAALLEDRSRLRDLPPAGLDQEADSP